VEVSVTLADALRRWRRRSRNRGPRFQRTIRSLSLGVGRQRTVQESFLADQQPGPMGSRVERPAPL